MYKIIILIHLLAATIWTGGHLILGISILPRAFKESSTQDLLKFESGFEVVGIPALIIQVVTGVYLALNRITEKNLSSLAYHIVPVTIFSVLLVIVGVSFRTESVF